MVWLLAITTSVTSATLSFLVCYGVDYIIQLIKEKRKKNKESLYVSKDKTGLEKACIIKEAFEQIELETLKDII